MRTSLSSTFLLVASTLLVSGCETTRAPGAGQGGAPESSGEPVGSFDAVVDPVGTTEDWEIEFQRQRLIGDLLYDALRALEQDRLLTPIDDNAHARYQRVLAYDPENVLALEGLQNIVKRYLELAEEAGRQGRFDDSLQFIERARFVDPDSPDISRAWLLLQADIDSGDAVFMLDLRELSAQSKAIRVQLADIARQAQASDALFLITAPSDEKARWIYSVMREAVDGYRLHGNIEIGSYAIVRLRKPSNENS